MACFSGSSRQIGILFGHAFILTIKGIFRVFCFSNPVFDFAGKIIAERVSLFMMAMFWE
jgi:flagellar motor component MotA